MHRTNSRIGRDDDVIDPINLKKCELIALKTKADASRRVIRQVRERTSMTPRELKAELRRVERSLEKASRAKSELIQANLRLVVSIAKNIPTGDSCFWISFRKVISV